MTKEWRVDDVWRKGAHRWAMTMPLTMAEWKRSGCAAGDPPWEREDGAR